MTLLKIRASCIRLDFYCNVRQRQLRSALARGPPLKTDLSGNLSEKPGGMDGLFPQLWRAPCPQGPHLRRRVCAGPVVDTQLAATSCFRQSWN